MNPRGEIDHFLFFHYCKCIWLKWIKPESFPLRHLIGVTQKTGFALFILASHIWPQDPELRCPENSESASWNTATGQLGFPKPISSLKAYTLSELRCHSTVVNMRCSVWGCVDAPFLWAETGSLLWVIWKLARRFGIIWFIVLSSGLHPSGHESKPSEPHNGCSFTLLVSGVSQHRSVCFLAPDCFAIIGS